MRTTGRVIRRALPLAILSVVLAGSFAISRPALASDPIVTDSSFGDWSGELNVSDPSGDVPNSRFDIVRFWWADNAGESYTYFRIDRGSQEDGDNCDEDDNGDGDDDNDQGCDQDDNGDGDDDNDQGCDQDGNGNNGDGDAHGKVSYMVHIDTNNNGVFIEHVDREVLVFYWPRNTHSEVDVTVRYADTDSTIGQVTSQDWGESKEEGGRYVEFKASFADLGISVNQTVRVYVESIKTNETPWDRAPDTGDIQWSPVNIMGYALLSVFMVGGAIIIWRYRGKNVWSAR